MHKILIADDEPGLAKRLAATLGGDLPDLQIHAVSSGDAAIAYLKGNTPDVIITDCFEGQRITGANLLDMALEKNPSTRGIVITPDPERARRLMRKAGTLPYFIGKADPGIENFPRKVSQVVCEARNLRKEEWAHLLVGHLPCSIERVNWIDLPKDC